jgi:Fe-S oxidoreductase
MDLCVGCKGCKRECPTGVDMARLKIEFLHQYHRRHGYRLQDKLIAYLPRYAPWAARLAPVLNLRNRIPLLAQLSQAWLGLSAKRSLPQWRGDSFLRGALSFSPSALTKEGWGKGARDTSRTLTPVAAEDRGKGDNAPDVKSAEQAVPRDVVLFADTFNNYFEPENLRAAQRVLAAAGYRVHCARPADGGRPLCCGRPFLALGMVDEARHEALRLLAALKPYLERGMPIVGLEPSCILTLRDEYLVLGLDDEDVGVLAERALLFEEFLAGEQDAGRLQLRLHAVEHRRALLHGHCHQKAFGAMPAVSRVLSLVPELDVQTVESSCCGMAGAFGYEAAHFDVSMAMGEAALFPAVRAANAQTLIVADGTSCRHQIHDGTSRKAVHVARILEQALSGTA